MGLTASAETTHQLSSPRLRLQRGTFDAHQPTTLGLDAAWLTAALGSYSILQFKTPPTTEDRERLIATGVRIHEYLPDFAYLVQGTVQQLEMAAYLPWVYAITPFVLADKLSPALITAVPQGQPIAGQFRITGWPGEQAALDRDLQPLNIAGGTAQIQGEAVLLQIARLPAVRWIEYATQPLLFGAEFV